MKRTLPPLLALVLLASCAQAQDDGMHTFSNAEGQTLKDRILKYDFEEKRVTLEKKGRVPLESFIKADQDYILRWNQVAGFNSTMRFKMVAKKSNWGRMKHEQTITPYYMDAVLIPGKKTPNHKIVMLDDYEEYNVVFLEAEGYEITFRNQNFFPIENLVVESKVFYEQEVYVTPDSLLLTSESEYTDTETTNKVRFISETVPIIIPREEVTMYSECAIIVDHQLDRATLVTTSMEEVENEDGDLEDGDDLEEGDEEAEEEEAELVEVIEGFGDWDDHSRRRKGKVLGVWFRVGIKGNDGEMIWRELTEPASLADKVSWEDSDADKAKKEVILPTE